MADNIGMYKVTAPDQATLAPGWYYGLTCGTCAKQYALFPDVHKGAKRNDKGEATFYCLCPFCAAPNYDNVHKLKSFEIS